MTLVNVWSASFQQHVGRAVATIAEHQIPLPTVRDLTHKVIRPSELVDGIVLTITGLTPEFRDTLVQGITGGGVLTIEDQPAFAYVYTEARWDNGTLHVAAIPLVTHLRRSCLPDWYVPDERFC
ncbi:hypothetical protein BN000_00625 [Mycobacterium europaeum]|uniref:Uncharacterized protein n=1 Tax=Mycobacterium europaeum TaxID=761804 RepID=A0A0U1CX34_9MYCO|nr:hypothetical protein [Mycobacterium europaeum]CQD03699.1 hypothetical protein BN000_00625 [Mycobacterium europaeum]